MRAAKAARGFQDFATALAEHLGECVSIEQAERCGVYLIKEVSPTIAPMIAALCDKKPGNVQEFALLWMAEHLPLADSLVKQLRSSLTDCGHNEHFAPAADPIELEYLERPSRHSNQDGAHFPGEPEDTKQGDCLPHAEVPSMRVESPLSPQPPAGQAPATRFIRRSSAPLVQQADSEPADEGEAPPQGSSGPIERRHSNASCLQSEYPRRRSGDDSVSTQRFLTLPDLSNASLPPRKRRDKRCVSYDFADTRARVERTRGGSGDRLRLPPKEKVIDMLRQVPMFARYTLEDLGRVADIAVVQMHAAGDVITFAGDVASGLHMLHSGSGNLYQLQDAGKVGPGSYFGEQSLQAAGSASSPVQVVASSEVACFTIPRDAFQALKLRQRLDRRAKMLRASSKSNACTAAADDSLDPMESTMRVDLQRHMVFDHEKTDTDRDLIVQAVSANVALSEVMSLSAEQCEDFADNVSLVGVPAGEDVFKKGDHGDAFYVVKEGMLKVNVSEDREVKLRLGDSFGELALMYDEMRSATVTAVVDCRLWVMSRQVFKALCREHADRRANDLASALRNVPALTALNVNLSIVACFFEETYFTARGDEVCTEGDDKGTLFIIKDGQCCFDGEEGTLLGPGDWYGEHQLLHDVPAGKTMVVCSDSARILSLDAASLKLATDFFANTNNMIEFRRSLCDVGVHCRSSTSNSNQVQFFHSLARCTVSGSLGEGSFGTVLYVRDAETHQSYAIKALNIGLLREQNQESMVKNERDLMQIMSSPFIVNLFHAYKNSDFVYFMMEAVLGGELFNLYSDNDLWGRLDLARFYVASVCLGLEHMHSHRVVWRDLKLENCLVDSRGYLKLTDFGIAKMVVGLTYTVCGTADYFAPEVLKQQGYNRGADWWACGVLLFIMMAGRSPFDAPAVHLIYKNIVKGMTKVTFPKGCPLAVEEFIRALCKKKPEERLAMRKGGINNLKTTDFFEDFRWDDLLGERMTPPFVPPALDLDAITSRPHRGVNTDFNDLEAWDDGPLGAETCNAPELISPSSESAASRQYPECFGATVLCDRKGSCEAMASAA